MKPCKDLFWKEWKQLPSLVQCYNIWLKAAWFYSLEKNEAKYNDALKMIEFFKKMIRDERGYHNVN